MLVVVTKVKIAATEAAAPPLLPRVVKLGRG